MVNLAKIFKIEILGKKDSSLHPQNRINFSPSNKAKNKLLALSLRRKKQKEPLMKKLIIIFTLLKFTIFAETERVPPEKGGTPF